MESILELIEFMFKSFWHFIGSFMIILMMFNFLIIIWNRFWRHLNIRKHGYPPQWCDADGDFKQQ
jgi:hypothetical protein